ncbi:lysophospholipid acyltransferase family protein, partial [Candidatus Pelagibacter bacterium]|nr:lysophospholipid acyltransferase family protein [Candidatus Pelagibacter bacterium]
EYLFLLLGPLFRSKKIFQKNLRKVFPDINAYKENQIFKNMWRNYGKMFAEYMFIKDFRLSKKFEQNLIIENFKILKQIKENKEPVIFISGHFNNFELMAMVIEKSGINLAAIYRPLNNTYLNPIMEEIRKKYICKKQIKKGISGTKQILKEYKNGASIALMIDQRVSQGILSDFFGHKALTTTIPAQFVKKFNTKVVPIYIERLKNNKFKLKIHDVIEFENHHDIETITFKLNKVLENMILKNPSQWIWTHDRWK